MRTITHLGSLLATVGGLIWGVMFLMEATSTQFDLRAELVNEPAVALALVLGAAFQAAGFYSLSVALWDFPVSRYAALIGCAGAMVQSLALFSASTLGFGAAWIFGILGELVITIALAAIAVSMIPATLSRALTFIPFAMVPLYFIGWAVDPQSGSRAGIDFVNLSAASYGFLWIPFGYAVWRMLRNRRAGSRPSQSPT